MQINRPRTQYGILLDSRLNFGENQLERWFSACEPYPFGSRKIVSQGFYIKYPTAGIKGVCHHYLALFYSFEDLQRSMDRKPKDLTFLTL